MRYTDEIDARFKLIGVIPDKILESDTGEETTYCFFRETSGFVAYIVDREMMSSVAMRMEHDGDATTNVQPVDIQSITQEQCRP